MLLEFGSCCSPRLLRKFLPVPMDHSVGDGLFPGHTFTDASNTSCKPRPTVADGFQLLFMFTSRLKRWSNLTWKGICFTNGKEGNMTQTVVKREVDLAMKSCDLTQNVPKCLSRFGGIWDARLQTVNRIKTQRWWWLILCFVRDHFKILSFQPLTFQTLDDWAPETRNGA